MTDAFKVVRDFEQALCDYTGAKYAVTTTSCTMALLLACKWHLLERNGPHWDVEKQLVHREIVIRGVLVFIPLGSDCGELAFEVGEAFVCCLFEHAWKPLKTI